MMAGTQLKQSLHALPILGMLMLQSCNAAPASHLPPRSLPLARGQGVFVEAETGRIDVSGTSSGALEIAGQAPSAAADALTITTSGDGVHITSKAPRHLFWQPAPAPLQLSLRVPDGAAITIDGFDPTVVIDGLSGKATITTVSGRITIQNSRGDFGITSNRGDVAVISSSGQVHVAGNYGLLSLQDARGTLGAATIMGTVRFAGAIGAADSVSLETDHGPVEIQLAQNSDATVQVGTTTGVITCIMPGLHYAGQGCAGALNTGEGRLTVRTVSGNVTLGQMP